MERLIKNSNGQWRLTTSVRPTKMLFDTDHQSYKTFSGNQHNPVDVADEQRQQAKIMNSMIRRLSDQKNSQQSDIGHDAGRTDINKQHFKLFGNMAAQLNYKKEDRSAIFDDKHWQALDAFHDTLSDAAEIAHVNKAKAQREKELQSQTLSEGYDDPYIKGHALANHLLDMADLDSHEYGALNALTESSHSAVDVGDHLETIGHLVNWYNSDPKFKESVRWNLKFGTPELNDEHVNHNNIDKLLNSAFNKIHAASHKIKAGDTIVYSDDPENEFWDNPGYSYWKHLQTDND